ncbi:MAG: 2,3-bisphosphoglycerate-independent phosphoglycerate mutase [Clostridiales Family XIII bacterium]|nr:2,3-bisphosphoglycerate-independent phosphoglycerate mutase [Clostridiales Family XIII bacterium]
MTKTDRIDRLVDRGNGRSRYRPTMLVILDGWGVAAPGPCNAVSEASTPNLDKLFAECPHTRLRSSGLAVGLPEGQMGNSEVGHLNIGAGRTVYQALTRITKSVSEGGFFTNPALLKAIDNAKNDGRSLHLMGLIGDGGVHSHQEHVVALLKLARKNGLERVYIHAYLDGRDTPPRSAAGYLADLESSIRTVGVGDVASISGRYYAMDRDNRWERVEKAYDALTLGSGVHARSVTDAISEAYARGENDEFVLPTNIVCTDGGRAPIVRDGDSVVFFNFRPDRARELTRCFVDPAFSGFVRKRIPERLTFVTMTEYDATMPHVSVAYPPENIAHTFGAYISDLGLTQLRIAETEKYAHVTFFFNGGVETPNPGEERVLIPSPKVATYDLQPEMSAYSVRDRAVREIASGRFDVIILNFANMDMVGHTGVMEAAVRAVEAVDACVGDIAAAIAEAGGQLLITADHGNSEAMCTEDGAPITAHSSNPVPLILFRADDAACALAPDGSLSDIAPTLLDMMGLAAPKAMTGHSLLVTGQR